MTVIIWALTLWLGLAVLARGFVQGQMDLLFDLQVFFRTRGGRGTEEGEADDFMDILGDHGFDTIPKVLYLFLMFFLYFLTLPLQKMLDRR